MWQIYWSIEQIYIQLRFKTTSENWTGLTIRTKWILQDKIMVLVLCVLLFGLTSDFVQMKLVILNRTEETHTDKSFKMVNE